MKRTDQQRKSYWLWLTRLAEQINDAGIEMEEIVIKLPKRATKENLHELCCKPAMTALYPSITSTEDPEFTTTKQQEVYQWVDQTIAERTGLHVEWPSEESLYWENAG